MSRLRPEVSGATLPGCLVECPGNLRSDHGPARLCERIVFANRLWLQLFELELSDVVGNAFAELPGFQGDLTDDSSMLRLSSLMVTEDTLVEGIRVVNYTARSKKAMECDLKITIYKHQGKNVFFKCWVTSSREYSPQNRQTANWLTLPQLMAESSQVPRQCPEPDAEPDPLSRPASLDGPEMEQALALHGPAEIEPSEEPLIERPAAAQPPPEWYRQAQKFVACTTRPCILVAWEALKGVRGMECTECILSANDAWYELYEYQEAQVVNRSFSSISGFEGPLTSSSSMLRLSSLVLSEESCVERLQLVSYTARSRTPIRTILRVDLFKQSGRNMAFACTVAAHTALGGGGGSVGGPGLGSVASRSGQRAGTLPGLVDSEDDEEYDSDQLSEEVFFDVGASAPLLKGGSSVWSRRTTPG